MKLEFRRYFHSIPDPAFFLEFIPFEELTDIIQLPNSSHTKFFATWRAPDSHILFNQIFTEEEVYQYCVQARWQFPDQRYQGGSAVILTPVHETDFLKDLQNFWGLWVSDCLEAQKRIPSEAEPTKSPIERLQDHRKPSKRSTTYTVISWVLLSRHVRDARPNRCAQILPSDRP